MQSHYMRSRAIKPSHDGSPAVWIQRYQLVDWFEFSRFSLKEKKKSKHVHTHNSERNWPLQKLENNSRSEMTNR